MEQEAGILQEVKENLTYDVLAELRELHLQGNKATAYVSRNIEFPLNDGKAIKLPACITRMFLQTWICHSSIRVPGAMILDPTDWDATPEAIDQSVPKDVPWELDSPTETKAESLPW